MNTQNVCRILVLFMLVSLFLSSCSMSGIGLPASTPTVTSSPTIPATPTPTTTPTITPTLTPRPNLTATLLYENLANKIKQLHDAGYLSTTEGKYNRLTDFPMELAKINWFDWEMFPDSPTNFVVSSDIAWESASAAANNSGCGFAFHIQDNSDAYFAYISLKGFAILEAYNGGWKNLGLTTFGNPSQTGKANLTLIVEDNTYRILVNDKLLKTYTGLQGKLSHGKAGYIVLSGTNKSYGTRCKFTNAGLWILP